MTIHKNKMLRNLGFRLEDQDYESLKKEAEREHMSLATWARKILLDKIRGRAFTDD